MRITTREDARIELRRLEQEERANRRLAAPQDEEEMISDETARLIAASIHPGESSALCRFAATGELDADAALDELTIAKLPNHRMRWVIALWAYLEWRDHPEPHSVGQRYAIEGQ
ncbi:hypothetical protein [Microbacterium sp.]|uniref:hypothetical protein n=1 Tax=Microbacterium sp. TaxID=51671 RepID=UPI0025ED6A10|nr:hypothetical protein [Microbacterium sp.]MBT9605908.1 hypothetical protein [Microbacterium sp.]